KTKVPALRLTVPGSTNATRSTMKLDAPVLVIVPLLVSVGWIEPQHHEMALAMFAMLNVPLLVTSPMPPRSERTWSSSLPVQLMVPLLISGRDNDFVDCGVSASVLPLRMV